MNNNKGAALVETVLILSILVSLLYFEKEGIRLSGLKLMELQKKRISYDGVKQ